MSTQRSLYLCIVLALLAGCTAEKSELATTAATKGELPKATRTGTVHDIRIAETISPPEIQVRPGDEVRWINVRNAPGKIVFTDPLTDKVSCQNKFAGKDSTTVNPNDYASLCFATPGTYAYVARMEAPVPGGESILSGTIKVEAAPTAGNAGASAAQAQ